MVPVLWICGPPGVGKSTIAWQLFTRSPEAAYVDIDQLGMCVSSTGGIDRRVLQIRALAALLPNYRAAGARCLIVSGVVDPQNARRYADSIPGAEVTLVRLRAEHHVLSERLAARGWTAEARAQALTEADELDRSTIADLTIDTSGRSVEQLTTMFLNRVASEPPPDEVRSPTPDAEPGGRLLGICGPTGVGKSAVGWHVFNQAQRSYARVGFVDLGQLGFLSSLTDPDALRAANLDAIRRVFAADLLVFVGQLDDERALRRYRDLLGRNRLTIVRLHAVYRDLAKRILARGRGEGPDLAGDRLRGRSPAELAPIAIAAAQQADRLEAAAIGDHRIDTTARDPAATAATILDLVAREVSRRRSSD